jgi:putative transposase
LLTEELLHAFARSRKTYGSPRLRHELRDRGQRCGRRRITRLMRQAGLRPVQKRRFVPLTTDTSQTRLPAPPRLLDAPAPTAPRQVWVTDMTYIPTPGDGLFLAAEIDLYSRRVVGWATADSMETTPVLQALQRATAESFWATLETECSSGRKGLSSSWM